MNNRSRAFAILGLVLVQLPASIVGVWAGYRLYRSASDAPVPDGSLVFMGVFLMIGSCLVIGSCLLQCVIVVRQLRRPQIAPPAR
jgi:TRAP-type C4-dicarboxylate transport system permease small subunit